MEASTLQRPCGATKRYDRLLVEDARTVDPSTGWVRRVWAKDEAIGSSTPELLTLRTLPVFRAEATG
jgi:hypothetical protein